MLKSIDCKIIRSWSVAKRTWDSCYSYLFIRQSTVISILTEAELEMLQKPLVASSSDISTRTGLGSLLSAWWDRWRRHVRPKGLKGWHGLMGCSCEPWDGLRGDGRMMLDLHTLCLDFHFEADYRGDLQPWWNAWYDQFCFFAGGPCKMYANVLYERSKKAIVTRPRSISPEEPWNCKCFKYSPPVPQGLAPMRARWAGMVEKNTHDITPKKRGKTMYLTWNCSMLFASPHFVISKDPWISYDFPQIS